MQKFISAYLSSAVVFLSIDAVWLTVMSNLLYRPVLGDILLQKPNLTPAAVFYAIFIFGIVYFAVMPALRAGDWTLALLNGALLGAVAYATYDLTNEATLKNWQTKLSVIDILWGSALTGVAATAGYFGAMFWSR